MGILLNLQLWQEQTMRLIEVFYQTTGDAFVIIYKFLSILN